MLTQAMPTQCPEKPPEAEGGASPTQQRAESDSEPPPQTVLTQIR